jgi:transcriptional regulator with XRE-family HTH domain
MDMPEVIRRRRTELGLSQADLARAANVDQRQIRRYEAGEQQPVLSVAVAIADALKISVGDLAGVPTHRVQLSGEWWSAWQTYKDGAEIVTSQEVRVAQQADLLTLETITRGLPTEEGGYHWRGELRIWDNEVLMGWYAANDKSVRSKGTMYFALHTHGQQMIGRWVGMSYDGVVVTGWGSMAHSESDARALIDELKQRGDLGENR